MCMYSKKFAFETELSPFFSFDHLQFIMSADFLLEVMTLDPKAVKIDDICLALLNDMLDEEAQLGDFKKYKHFEIENFTDDKFKSNFHFDKNGFCELYTDLGLLQTG